MFRILQTRVRDFTDQFERLKGFCSNVVLVTIFPRSNELGAGSSESDYMRPSYRTMSAQAELTQGEKVKDELACAHIIGFRRNSVQSFLGTEGSGRTIIACTYIIGFRRDSVQVELT